MYLLRKEIEFPSTAEALADGLLALGGDLSPARLLKAYSLGIFPWYSDSSPILWWAPNPRGVIFPHEFKLSKRLKRYLSNSDFSLKLDCEFEAVLQACAKVKRAGQAGTWISPEMIKAYLKLYELGYGHSLEVYSAGKLVGGLYGVAQGGVFFAESMYHTRDFASSYALAALVAIAKKYQLGLIDCQFLTPHLARFKARNIPRNEFNQYLNRAPDLTGNWHKQNFTKNLKIY